jgi:hypothetical protein
MKKCKILSLVTVALLLAALSAAAGPKFAEEPGIPEGRALIYIYFPKGYYNTPVIATVMSNQKPVAMLKQRCYFPYIAEPGSIDFWAVTYSTNSIVPSTHVKLDVEANREYFLYIAADMFALMLMVVTRERAMSEITACYLHDSAAD